MKFDLYNASLAVVAFVSLIRFTWIIVGKFRQFGYRKRAISLPGSWADVCTVPEPFVMALLTWMLWSGRAVPPQPSPADLATVLAGAGLAFVGLALSLWSFLSFPTVSTGHYVLPDQHIVTRGAYGVVRHPIYLAVFLIWASIVLTFHSALALAVLVFYVVPAYLVYIRSEEEMLVRSLGEEYRRYRDDVGGLLPRRRKRHSV
ncbi:MAG: isoprenylcysteine carboxylmethyltransferase family protein [Deltaproteobacteria bacterium]|nr:isoprenylcysteine carboxylmethyltransferase family protein [Deltaproteobacteria bacterium]MBW2725713.1 isoprenylcysteine carboxylmethyltransferase family protein [Deltaproteobacteria bacterium]